MKYEEFLKTKKKHISESGFIPESSNKKLFPFQKFAVETALRKGKYAIFSGCGTGKTLMQLEWSRQVVNKIGKHVLILAPLAVSGQTILEGKKFGIEVEKLSLPILKPFTERIFITNYEQLENIDSTLFGGIVLDESSILKNFEGSIKKQIIDKFSKTTFKLACTATPSPNDPMELGNHSEFLNIMSRNEMLAMYFVHDAGKTQEWRIKGHAVKEFYSWVS